MNCSMCNSPAAKHELPGGKCAKCWREECDMWKHKHKRRCEFIDSLDDVFSNSRRKIAALVKAARRWKARAQETEETLKCYKSMRLY